MERSSLIIACFFALRTSHPPITSTRYNPISLPEHIRAYLQTCSTHGPNVNRQQSRTHGSCQGPAKSRHNQRRQFFSADRNPTVRPSHPKERVAGSLPRASVEKDQQPTFRSETEGKDRQKEQDSGSLAEIDGLDRKGELRGLVDRVRNAESLNFFFDFARFVHWRYGEARFAFHSAKLDMRFPWQPQQV